MEARRREPQERSIRSQILEAMRALALAVVTEVWAELSAMPAYAALGSDEAAAARRSIKRVFEIMTNCLDEARGLSAAEIAEFMALGAARARAGIPLDVVNAGFRVGSEQARHHLRRVARQLGRDEGEAVRAELLERLFRLHEEALAAIERGYMGAPEALAAQLAGTGQLADALVQDRLDQDGLNDWLSRRGVAPNQTGTIAVAVAGDGSDTANLAELVGDLVRRLPGAVDGAVATIPVPHVVVFCLAAWPGPNGAASTLEVLSDRYGVHVAIITDVPPTTWGATYRRIQPIVEPLARRYTGEAYRPNDLLACELATFAPPKWALERVREILGCLLAELRADGWLAAASALAGEAGNVKAAARRLRVSPSRLYQLRTEIQECTDIDLLDPHVARRVSLALWLMAAHPDVMPEAGDLAWAYGH